jgi:hypothetical protein
MACEPELARKIVGSLPAQYEAFMVRGLNDSPLLERLAA